MTDVVLLFNCIHSQQYGFLYLDCLSLLFMKKYLIAHMSGGEEGLFNLKDL